MNRKTTISATIDPLLKGEVQAILKRLGLSTSQAITLFFQQVQQAQTLPFVVAETLRKPETPELLTTTTGMSCLELMQDDIGCLQDAPPDLSTNKSYLNDYGL